MSVPARKKQPITVASTGSLVGADFRALAGVLLNLSQQNIIKAIPNEQPSSVVPQIFKRPQ
jgi:hypothetical protein